MRTTLVRDEGVGGSNPLTPTILLSGSRAPFRMICGVVPPPALPQEGRPCRHLLTVRRCGRTEACQSRHGIAAVETSTATFADVALPPGFGRNASVGEANSSLSADPGLGAAPALSYRLSRDTRQRDAPMASGLIPLHPGPALRTDVLDRLGVSVSQAARDMKIALQTLHSVLAGRAAVTPDMALRIAKLSSTPPEIWLAMQQKHDLWRAEQDLAAVLATIAARPAPRRPTGGECRP